MPSGSGEGPQPDDGTTALEPTAIAPDYMVCDYCQGIMDVEAIEDGSDYNYDWRRHCYAQFCDSSCRRRHIIFCQCISLNQTSGWPEFWEALGNHMGGHAYSMRTYVYNARLVARGDGTRHG